MLQLDAYRKKKAAKKEKNASSISGLNNAKNEDENAVGRVSAKPPF